MHVLIRVQMDCAKFDHWNRIRGKSRIFNEKERKRRDESLKKTPNFMYTLKSVESFSFLTNM